MTAVKAIYDGVSFKPLSPIPVKGNYEVIITFVEPVKQSGKNIMEFAGIWKDKADLIDLEKIMIEREDFSSGRISGDDIS